MGFANEILDAIEIMVRQCVEDNTTKIYTGVCKSITTTTCTLTINGKDNTVKYYGGTPIVGTVYQVFIPFGNMSAAFIIVPGSGGGTVTGVTSVNGKTGAVVLNANDVGALPSTTAIPTKTSELDNDSGFIDSSALDGYAKTTDIPTRTSQLTNNSGFITVNDVPVKSVDGSTGTVVTNAVKTTSQSLTNEQKTQARTNIGAGTSSFDGNYESLSNKPTIPTQTSQLENNSGFITASDIPVKSVNSKTGNVVLTADDVGALPDTTVIPTVNDATLDVQRNGVSVGTFTANASTDKTININVPTKASDIGALPDTTSIPTKTSDLTNDSGYITSDDVPVKSVNGKTGEVELGASDVGALAAPATMTANRWLKTDASGNVVLSNLPNASTGARGITYLVDSYTRTDTDKAVTPKALNSVYKLIPDVTQTLGSSTDKVPSEKAVADAIGAAGGGDMLKTTYDPDGTVATSGGIPAYVEVNGGKIDTIKVNGTAQPIVNKEVDIAAVTSVNGQTGDVTVTADIPDNLVKYTAVSDVQSVDGLNADTLEGHNAAYFGTAAAVEENSQIIEGVSTQVGNVQESVQNLQNQFIQVANNAVYKSGDTMTGVLIAQNNTNYTIAQVRNVIISTADPSGGSNGMLWIKYTP